MKAPAGIPDIDTCRRRVLVRGVVQGVGFRPYVFRLAQRHGLSGFVQNTSLGAVIELQGATTAVEAFLQALAPGGPPLMRISSIDAVAVPPIPGEGFTIVESDHADLALALVPPDIAVCDPCLAEMQDAGDRRYGYPFNNCTNCGPRYSIILDVPYDRRQTTMAGFTMCNACRREYEDPANRRFHAQPIACPACGPHLRLTDRCGKVVPLHGTRAILGAVASLLRCGGLVAWKGLGGYQLACDARNEQAVQLLRERKHRNEKAFAVMVRDAAVAESLCDLSAHERAILTGPEKPIVLLRNRPGGGIAPSVAPGCSTLGVMLPYTPMHAMLFRVLEEASGRDAVLVMTSGNLSDEPIVIDETEAQQRLGTVADLLVHHNRPIHTRVDDSVARIVDEQTVLLRRARGYTPSAISLGRHTAQVLAFGAQGKSTFCLTKDGSAILSQHLGDLESYETLQFFEQTMERLQRLCHMTPEAVVHDLHPGYLSTQMAKRHPAEQKFAVQHHHAHIASCMAEHGLEGPVLGVAWDGTGLGPDGSIWGGEFLVADRKNFERYGHLRKVLLPGGDSAAREPWRVARSYLYDTFDTAAPGGIGFHHSVLESSVRIVDAMLEKRIYTTETSSCGRLFDAVASLLGLHQLVSFEGQAAMGLETIAGDADGTYNFAIDGSAPLEIDMRPMVRQIVDDVDHKEPPSRISACFHNTLVSVVQDVCARMRRDTGLTRVCLSGGCFQNVRLLRGCVHTLRAHGFDVFFQQQVPSNDGGIALGQAAVVCALLRKGL